MKGKHIEAAAHLVTCPPIYSAVLCSTPMSCIFFVFVIHLISSLFFLAHSLPVPHFQKPSNPPFFRCCLTFAEFTPFSTFAPSLYCCRPVAVRRQPPLAADGRPPLAAAQSPHSGCRIPNLGSNFQLFWFLQFSTFEVVFQIFVYNSIIL